MKNTLAAILLACSTLALPGCYNSQHVDKKYEFELSRLYPGDSVDKFHSLFPAATPAGENTVDGQKVDTYELSHQYISFSQDHYDTEKMFFYFSDGKFVKYALPEPPPKPHVEY